MAISDRPDWQYNGEEVFAFQKKYPDVYDFVLKILGNNYDDETIALIIDKYGEEFLSTVFKIIIGKETSSDIEVFREEYSDIYIFIRNMLDGNPDWANKISDIVNWIKDIEQRKNRKAREIRFYRGLDEQAPRWEVINKKAGFVIWLNKKNANTGKRNIDLIKQPYDDYDFYTVACFYNYFSQKALSEKNFFKEDNPQNNFKKDDMIGEKYQIFDILGEGGFGVVYLVYSHETNAVYALKTFRNEYLHDAQTRNRFRKEAQVWIDLDWHPYLVRAYLVDEIAGRLFIALEYIGPDEQGLNSLKAYLKHQPPDLSQSLRWAIQFCHGMEYACSRGISAHRDINPANIMIDQNKAVKITDFGLAGILLENSDPIGTPEYMSPEQFTDLSSCDERSDIYSFGIVLYQMASGGKLPFSSDNLKYRWAVLKHFHCENAVPKLDSPLFPVIQKCLEKESIRRYQSFKELREVLETIIKAQTGEIIGQPEGQECKWWEWGIKGNSLSLLSRYEEALSCYDKVLKVWRGKETLFAKGLCLSNLNRFDEAIQYYDEAIQSDQNYIDAWISKGLCLSNTGRLDDALNCFNKALEIDPNETAALNNTGNIFSKLCNYHKAIIYYDKALDINPQYAIAWRNKGLCFDRLRHFEKAIASYDKALEINPLYDEAWDGKGSALENLKKYEEAIDCYDKVLEITHRDAQSWYNKGRALEILCKYNEALVCYDESLKIDPKYAVAWYGKALAEDKLGQKQDAVFSYKRFIELAPEQYAEQIEYARYRLKELGEYL